jgi:hypothetical protein
MDMHNSFFFVRYSREKVFRKKKSGQLQRKVGKFGQTAKIIIFVRILDHITNSKKSGRFGEKSGKT